MKKYLATLSTTAGSGIPSKFLRLGLQLMCCIMLIPQAQSETIPEYKNLHQRQRPVIAVLADNRMTELSDFVIPYGVLKQAKIAEVKAVAPQQGWIQFFPALQAYAELSLADFEREYQAGADYVIVPALHYDADPLILNWLRKQAAQGATIVAICDGAWVVANAGLLQGKRATSFWYAQPKLQRRFPDTHWQANRRYLADQNIVTTSGVSAALPAAIALVAAIAGTELATQLASSYAETDWSSWHRSDQFEFRWQDYWQIAKNYLSFWRHQQRLLKLSPGMDEVALALQADAYSRTYRDKVISYHATLSRVSSRNGLAFLVEQNSQRPNQKQLPELHHLPAIAVLQQTMHDIQIEQGEANCRLVQLLLEYPKPCTSVSR